MQSLQYAGLILIDEGPNVSGRPLFLSAINQALKRGFKTRVLLFADTENSIISHLSGREDIELVNCHADGVRHLELLQNEANAHLNQSRMLLVIDTVTPLIRCYPIQKVISALYAVAENIPVLTRFRHDIATEVGTHLMRSLANVLLTLSVDTASGKQVCTTLTYNKKTQLKVREKVESYTIDPETLNIVSQAFETKPSVPPSVVGNDFLGCAASNRPTASSIASGTRTQREKASVVLPFTRAQTEQGLVGLNANTRRNPLGAKIEYFADKEDDLDDSDPDDDLMY